MGWKEKHISKVGRKVLIKIVAQAISTYSMSLFKIPRIVCDGINSILVKYWWGQMRNERKINWISWGKLCSPKNKGGLWFQDIHVFNLAMLAKQAWRLIHGTHFLFYHVYKARYFPTCSFMDAELGSNPSFVLFGVVSSRLRRFFRRVQHGKLVMAKMLVSTATNGCLTHLDLNLVQTKP